MVTGRKKERKDPLNNIFQRTSESDGKKKVQAKKLQNTAPNVTMLQCKCHL
jgi:hypothetical protein